MSILDVSDPIFGFAGVSALMPLPWKRTVFEMNLAMEVSIENCTAKMAEWKGEDV